MRSFYSLMEELSARPSDFHPPPEVIENTKSTTVVDEPETTVVDNPETTVVNDLWRAEGNGLLFPAARVRPIRRAQDALNHAEESVYDVLWGPKDQTGDVYRIRQLGYQELANGARTTKRNAALIIERLIEKGFISLEREADKKSPRVYRVSGYRAALDDLARRGRKWFVKSGNGILFAYPVTVVVDSSTTVVVGPRLTVVAGQSTTVVADQSTTVVAATTVLDSKKDREEKTENSSSSSEITSLVTEVGRLGVVGFDDDAARKLIRNCRRKNPAATIERMIYHAGEKILQLSGGGKNVQNWVGLLITAVPQYF